MLPKKDDVYDYNSYFETTSSNFIIYSKGDYYTLKDANNNKGILYYQDKDKPEYYFRFFTNDDSKRILTFASLLSSGWWGNYVHADDINK